mmetsp:Transcript_17781/g.57523  ORF Transcript_17781/g.57523 Transcript_17781/m.57523 type:complete len:338 (+) Transcript_17781:1918-2931(+)
MFSRALAQHAGRCSLPVVRWEPAAIHSPEEPAVVGEGQEPAGQHHVALRPPPAKRTAAQPLGSPPCAVRKLSRRPLGDIRMYLWTLLLALTLVALVPTSGLILRQPRAQSGWRHVSRSGEVPSGGSPRRLRAVLLTLHRSGSNLLVDAIGQNPGINFEGEVMDPVHPWFSGGFAKAHFVPGMRLWEMTQLHTLPTKFKAHCKPNCRTAQDPEAFLAEFWQAGNSSSVLGFKLMRNQLREEQVERLLLRDPGVAKLVLYRDDQVARCKSLKLAFTTGKFVDKSPAHTPRVKEDAKEDIRLQANDLKACMNEARRWYGFVIRALVAVRDFLFGTLNPKP